MFDNGQIMQFYIRHVLVHTILYTRCTYKYSKKLKLKYHKINLVSISRAVTLKGERPRILI